MGFNLGFKGLRYDNILGYGTVLYSYLFP